MCTRYYVERGETEIDDIVEAALSSPLAKKFQIEMSKPMVTKGEVRPTDVAPVIAPNKKGARTVYPMKWGFTVVVDGRSKPVVNARVETAAAKNLFKESWARRRCIVPASWYFEWEHFKDDKGKVTTGDRYVLQPSGSAITWMCGLYRLEDGMPVFAILTKKPTEELARIHDRMPLVLPKDMINDWINPESKPEELLPYALTDIYAERIKDYGNSESKSSIYSVS